jgi:hypothetical protein
MQNSTNLLIPPSTSNLQALIYHSRAKSMRNHIKSTITHQIHRGSRGEGALQIWAGTRRARSCWPSPSAPLAPLLLLAASRLEKPSKEMEIRRRRGRLRWDGEKGRRTHTWTWILGGGRVVESLLLLVLVAGSTPAAGGVEAGSTPPRRHRRSTPSGCGDEGERGGGRRGQGEGDDEG